MDRKTRGDQFDPGIKEGSNFIRDVLNDRHCYSCQVQYVSIIIPTVSTLL